MILGTVFIENYFRIFCTKAGSITPISSNPVAIVDETLHDHILTFRVESDEKQDVNLLYADPSLATRAISLSLMCKTMVKVKTSTEGIRLVGTQEHLIRTRQALVAQDIADTAPGFLFNIKVENLSLSYTTLSNAMKIAECSAVPPT